MRLLENVLAVGEDPSNLVVYAALGRAARNWPAHKAIVQALTTMEEDQTLVIQSGKPVGLLRTHAKAPLVIMANCNIVGQWAKAEIFYELRAQGPDLLGRTHGRRLAIYRLAGRHSGHLRDLHAYRRTSLRRRRSLGASCSPPGSAAWAARSRSPAAWPGRRSSPSTSIRSGRASARRSVISK